MNKNESKYFNTAKKMNDALIILLEHKDFEYITIKDICLEANVNRSTFYLHYSNLNDLLEEVISSLSISFSKHFNSSDNISIINNNNLPNPVVKKGVILFEVAGVSDEIAREALRLASHKLPCSTKVVVKVGDEQ